MAVADDLYTEPEYALISVVGCRYCGAKVGQKCAEPYRGSHGRVRECTAHASRHWQLANLRGQDPPYAIPVAPGAWRTRRGSRG